MSRINYGEAIAEDRYNALEEEMTTTKTAAEYYGSIGKNVMTPEVLSYHDTDDGLMIELSSGRGFDNAPIYGVSVAEPNKGYRSGYASREDLRGLFDNEADARERVRLLLDGPCPLAA